MAKLSPQLKTELRQAVVWASVWQFGFLLLIFGIQLLHNEPLNLNYFTKWDGGHYLSIINGSYSSPLSPAAAFYPLLPLSIRLLQILTLGVVPIGFLIILFNTFCLSIAIFFFRRIARHFNKNDTNDRLAVLLWLAFPTAFFMSQFYTEPLFCALALAAYYFSLTRKWLIVGVLLAFLSATRLPALLIIGLCGLEFFHQHNWQIKKILNKNLLWFLLAPIGFLAYGFYLLQARGDFLGMFSAYKLTNDWTYQVFNPNFLATLAKEAKIFLTNPFTASLTWGDYLVNHALPLLSLGLLFVAAIYFIKKHRQNGYALGIASLVSIMFYSLNSNIVSVQRYVLANFVIFLVAANLLTRLKPKYRTIATISCLAIGFLAQIIFLWWFMRFKFVG